MDSLLNSSRPPVYCPGCSHETIIQSLDKGLSKLGLRKEEIVIVSDIGCSGLSDTFFHTHALHGTHGRALTYAVGLKLARPHLTVIVTMGDGGLGIGMAHVIAACRRNLDITLLVLNNFNFGMTGGQYSLTTPQEAVVDSSFLNRAETPLDICEIAESAGATFVTRSSALEPALAERIGEAVLHKGFSLVETLGICTGRYTKKNPLSAKILDSLLDKLPPKKGPVDKNSRPEYGEQYRQLALDGRFPGPVHVPRQIDLPGYVRREVVILGSAGMRIVTAGEILCHAGLAAGLRVSAKNDYNITVLRGQSVSEVILSPKKIGYTGITTPDVVLALSDEGVQRRHSLFRTAPPDTLIIKERSIAIPKTRARICEADFSKDTIPKREWALASIYLLALKGDILNMEMLDYGLRSRLDDKAYRKARERFVHITVPSRG